MKNFLVVNSLSSSKIFSKFYMEYMIILNIFTQFFKHKQK
ncbi:hypothetical protein HMPREF1987_00782 [Peptostreptococcaceae bacterium oral taxon 113 str. W5053]|nr:hypothetical protein HMPREF1987_00782 [Peptostreptococcaceae bacterium oral taxon 113 str. W5053]